MSSFDKASRIITIYFYYIQTTLFRYIDIRWYATRIMKSYSYLPDLILPVLTAEPQKRFRDLLFYRYIYKNNCIIWYFNSSQQILALPIAVICISASLAVFLYTIAKKFAFTNLLFLLAITVDPLSVGKTLYFK